MLHCAYWNDEHQNRKLSGRGVAMKEVDAEMDGFRGDDGGRLSQFSRNEGARIVASISSRIAVPHASPSFGGDECMWGAGAQEGSLAIVARGGESTLHCVCLCSGGKGGVADGGNTVREARSMHGDRRRYGVRGIKFRSNIGDQSTSRSWCWEEGGKELVQCGGCCRGCHGRADLVDTGETRVGRGGAGGVVNVPADLYENVA